MKFEFKEGYSVFKKGNEDIVIVTPHSGPAMERSTYQDANSETVASLLWKDIGGKFVVANMARKRMWGVDFNRALPPKKLAISLFKDFVDYIPSKKTKEFKEKYSFVSMDDDDYERRERIYKNFWDEIRNGKKIIMIHRAFPRVKAYPSIMDIVTFDGKGADSKKVHRAVSRLNMKYYQFFKEVENDFKRMVEFEAKRFINELVDIFGEGLDPKKINESYSEEFGKDMDKIKRYADKDIVDRLDNDFSPQIFLDGVSSALSNMGPPKITVEEVFSGKFALGPKNELFPNKGKIILEIEPNRFLNFWHPKITANIIKELIEDLD